MNINKSLDILNLNDKYNLYNINYLTVHEIKKAYHVLALNYHPDKNNELGSKAKFIQAQEAHNFLQNYKKIENNINLEAESNIDDELSYSDLISDFIKMILKNEYNEIYINEFQNNCIEYSYKILEKLKVNILEEIYVFLINLNSNNIYNINISDKTFSILKEIIKNKLKDFNIYILNPDLNNLFNSDVYKLEIIKKDISLNEVNEENKDIIYAPLWHNELEYENNIIKIEATLPKNILIDNNNNIHYNYYSSFTDIINLLTNDLSNSVIEIIIDKLNLTIPIQELYIKNYQTYIFKNIGIPLINTCDIFDNSKKSSIIIHVNLHT
tara:strand:+ start:4442 stop:5419 length:978 start_codon:yes stop_codon:yes gene_type:complete